MIQKRKRGWKLKGFPPIETVKKTIKYFLDQKHPNIRKAGFKKLGLFSIVSNVHAVQCLGFSEQESVALNSSCILFVTTWPWNF